MIRVAIVEDSKELALGIKEYLIAKNINVVGIANTGREGEALIKNGGFDVLLLDLILPEIDGLTLIKQNIPRTRAYKVISFSAFGRDDILMEAKSLGVDYFLLKPVQLNVIYNHIIRLSERNDSMLRYFQNKLKGTKYLKDALCLIEQNPALIHSLTVSLYPKIAEIYNVNPSSIERAIRNAIENAWKNGLNEHLFKHNVYTKPTIGEILLLLTENKQKSSSKKI